MKEINSEVVCRKIISYMDTLHDKELDHIVQAAKMIAESIKNDGVVQVFGSGHSIGFGMEFTGKPGSLAPVHTINSADFVIRGLYSLDEYRDRTNVFERRPGIAKDLYELYDIHDSDVFIIISNSGINGLVIDLANEAKSRGHQVIVITSWEHTSAEPSRHPLGKKLYEFGDVVIDNCGPQGDAMLETGEIEKVCSISSITGAMIAQALCENVCHILQDEGIEPPVYNGSVDHDQALREHYKGRI